VAIQDLTSNGVQSTALATGFSKAESFETLWDRWEESEEIAKSIADANSARWIRESPITNH